MTRYGFLRSHPVILPAWDETHGVVQTLQITRLLGTKISDRRLVYHVRDEERSAIESKLKARGILMEKKSIVVFQVGGGRRSSWRDWPSSNFIELGNKLLQSYDVQLILLGGPDLVSKATEIKESLPPEVVNLTGKLSLEESAALLSVANILVSTDTGIMHLGFAIGIDTVAIIHCNNPSSRVGPFDYGDQHPVVELKPPPGVPASKSVNMALIKPSDVWTKLMELCQRQNIAPYRELVREDRPKHLSNRLESKSE
jgi:ADP-heptose:LPS heptosyltransferase